MVYLLVERIDIVKKALYLVAVLGLLLTTACGNPKLKDGSEVVAKIDGKEYTADDLYKELKSQYGYNTIINWVDKQIAENEVETTDEINKYVDEAIEFYSYYANAYQMSLADFAAQYLGLSGVKNEDDLRQFILQDRKITVAVQNRVASKLSDKEVEDFYNENYKNTFTYYDILIADDESAEDTIKDIKKQLDGKKDEDLVNKFKEIAKEKSTSSSASDNGYNKEVTKNNMNSKVWDKLNDLKDNDYNKDALKTDDGYYILLRVSKNKGKELKDVKEEIRQTIAGNKMQSDEFLRYDVLTELRNKYKLAFYDSDLNESYRAYLKQIEDAKASNSNSNSNK